MHSIFAAHIYNWVGSDVTTTTNNATDLINSKTSKDCIQERGGIKVNSSRCPEYEEAIVLWYKKINRADLSDGARKYCQDRGWRLFGEYNGTQEQTDWLFYETDFIDIYMVIERLAGETDWISDKGEKMNFVIKNLTNSDKISITRRIGLFSNNKIIF